MGKKRKRRRSARTDTDHRKLSELVIEYAGAFIAMGEDLEDKQSHLNLACSAWNIANLPSVERSQAIQRYLDKYLEYNPHVQDEKNLRHDMQLLIQNKLRLFPEIRKEIISAEIVEAEGREQINVASISQGPSNCSTG